MLFSTTITIDDIGPVLFVKSGRARRLSITIRPFKGVRVTVPFGVSFHAAESLVRKKIDILRKHIRAVKKIEQAEPVTHPPVPYIDRNTARKKLNARLSELAERHGLSYNRVSIRYQKSRWGSCSSKNNISLNAFLLTLPGHLIDYVLLHELVHTRIKNHSPAFWAELDRLSGWNSRALRREMRNYRIPGVSEMDISPTQ